MKLIGVKAIAQYVGKHENTVMTWRYKREFPMYQVQGGWEAETEKIDRWKLTPSALEASMDVPDRVYKLEQRILDLEDKLAKFTLPPGFVTEVATVSADVYSKQPEVQAKAPAPMSTRKKGGDKDWLK